VYLQGFRLSHGTEALACANGTYMLQSDNVDNECAKRQWNMVIEGLLAPSVAMHTLSTRAPCSACAV